jgi:hypothetical protein
MKINPAIMIQVADNSERTNLGIGHRTLLIMEPEILQYCVLLKGIRQRMDIQQVDNNLFAARQSFRKKPIDLITVRDAADL